jgi:hypothetical protein
MTFLSGVTCALNFVAALLFLRFYHRTSDRLFIYFAAAFALFAINRILFLIINVADEARTSLYAVRLAGFILILCAIFDKNRKRCGPKAP